MKENLEKLRRDAVAIYQAGLKAVAPGAALRRYCQLDGKVFNVADRSYDLDSFDRLLVLGAGKGAAAMAKEVEAILGEEISEGLITVKYDHLESLRKIKMVEAAHPVPDENGLHNARAILDLASGADEKTLIICLISGGGSALMPLPVEGVSLQDKQQTTRVLLGCGATIHEINSIRKHLSRIKGGGLAKAAFPATLVTLILSDVVGDDLDAIASGPCVPDPNTFADCLAIFDKYQIRNSVPPAVLDHIVTGAAGKFPETPKTGDKIFNKTNNLIIGRNYDALIQSREEARSRGYNTLLLSSMVEGETREVAATHMAMAREIGLHDHPAAKPACLLSGGETTVTIKGKGKGGRNQEFALAAVLRMGELDNCVVLSAGTDGTDGPTDAAGALSDNSTIHRARKEGLDPALFLHNNDSYTFFSLLDDLYKTGPTNTNVMDLRVILID